MKLTKLGEQISYSEKNKKMVQNFLGMKFLMSVTFIIENIPTRNYHIAKL